MVLEARADADKVWYPVVWEKTKDADNVIDYDIREEQTKDVSAEINANNQTTTGMATVIPWVNAPKLIESTSIISNPSVWYIYARADFKWDPIPWNDSEVLKVLSITDKMWEPNFTINATWLRVKFPRDWVYYLHIYYANSLSYAYRLNTDVYTDLKWTIAYDEWVYGQAHEKELTLEFKKWEVLTVYCSVLPYSEWTWTVSPTCVILFTRLW
jgi:hypothetical protein